VVRPLVGLPQPSLEIALSLIAHLDEFWENAMLAALQHREGGRGQYRITMAVAGFSPDELNLTTQPNWLVVSGQKQGEESTQYLHRGIATRSFERRFELADHVKVKDARLDNGLLMIELVREVPEEMRPRRIEVQAWNALGAGQQPQQVEHQKAA
jgi:molecular chaperone IbpA